MTETSCKKCKDTGTSRWGGFYERRGPSVACDACDKGAFMALPESVRLEVSAYAAALREEERKAARAARRAARAQA